MSETVTGIEVKLLGTDGNAFALMGRVRSAMVRARVEQEVIDAFMEEATSGDYNHLLATCMKYVEVT